MKSSFIATFAISCLNMAAQVETKEPERSCRLYFLNRPADAPKEAYIFDGKTSHKAYLSGKSFSNPIPLPPGEITVGMSFERVDDPEDFPEGAPSVTLPEKAKDIFIVLYDDPENEAFPAKMKLVNSDDKNLKPGETLWINLTSHNVAAMLGEHKFNIPPSKPVISPAPMEADGYYPAIFFYQPDGKGEYLKALDKSWRFQLNSKSLGFILDTGGRRPEIFTIRDLRTTNATSISAPE